MNGSGQRGGARGASNIYKPPTTASTYRAPPVISLQDTPLMKLLFPRGFSTSLESGDILGGLANFKLFFINDDDITGVIVALETIRDSVEIGMKEGMKEGINKNI